MLYVDIVGRVPELVYQSLVFLLFFAHHLATLGNGTINIFEL